MARHWIAHRPGGLEVFELVDVDVPAPGRGEVNVVVRASGLNPADAKHVAEGNNPDDFPRPVGYEVAGVVTAIGPDTELASGYGAVGDEVLAFRVRGGWASELTIPAQDVFAKPPGVSFEQAANLLLAATTASEMLHVTGVGSGETVLVHGASGAVGVMLLQQAALLGARVVGTASPARFDVVRRYGGEPVAHGDGLGQRVRTAAPEGVAAALDCIGSDEALAVSLALVSHRSRMVSIVAPGDRAAADGYHRIWGGRPASKAYRDSVRAELIEAAGAGKLEVPVAATYPLEEALTAAEVLQGKHPGGKLALVP
ncbi:NADP-dependent oxidoreductase [Nocardioides sp.]|jgi:NADPH:quinone reductase-like Zn-dependent oxidoreductase|uniref:quinone oxidoreductase family protein n=1 Tax=Nocardioides sp. TaxID=35761 RepID=UPI002F3EC5B2